MTEDKNRPSISVVTVSYNNGSTIKDTLESVIGQDYTNLEYIVVDGDSADGTVNVLEHYESNIDVLISEPDNGPFDAMNKGLKHTTGEIVGILNADDVYAHSRVLNRVSRAFARKNIDATYGDLVYTKKQNLEEVVRYWRGGKYHRRKFWLGWMPPHPTFFVRRSVYGKYGYFDESMDISSDYELMFRFLYRHRIKVSYIPEILVRMRVGGNSNESIFQRLRGHKQDYKAWLKNGVIPNPATLAMKPFSKIHQWWLSSPPSTACPIRWWD